MENIRIALRIPVAVLFSLVFSIISALSFIFESILALPYYIFARFFISIKDREEGWLDKFPLVFSDFKEIFKDVVRWTISEETIDSIYYHFEERNKFCNILNLFSLFLILLFSGILAFIIKVIYTIIVYVLGLILAIILILFGIYAFFNIIEQLFKSLSK